jgi:hypothetical protein
MSKFLTVAEAAKLVGKSPSSIRRIIYPILENDQHPDRHQIEPSPDEAKALRLKGENFPWRIAEELLRRHVPEAGTKAAGESKAAPAAGGDGSAALLEMLQRELDIKNRQIETQNELLKGLSERLREGNILIGSLQQQLALPEGGSRQRHDAVSTSVEPAQAAQGTAPEPKKPAKTAKKRGLFRRLFRH